MENIFASAFIDELEKAAFFRSGYRAIKQRLKNRRFKGQMRKKLRDAPPGQKHNVFLEGMGDLSSKHNQAISDATKNIVPPTKP